jgi:hypothetical protein
MWGMGGDGEKNDLGAPWDHQDSFWVQPGITKNRFGCNMEAQCTKQIIVLLRTIPTKMHQAGGNSGVERMWVSKNHKF